jgi:hypothetical protein
MVKVDDAVSVNPSLCKAWQHRGNFLFSLLFSLHMKDHPTKNKGDLGVLKAQADLCAKGFLVCLPLSEHAPFDLVAYKQGIFRRIQVKARTLKRGKLDIRFEHSYSDSRGVHTKRVDMNSIDVYCVYCMDNDTCYYFSASDFMTHTFYQP